MTKLSCVPSEDSNQSSLCAPRIAKDPRLLYADSQDSDLTEGVAAQADLSLHWVHISFC